MTSASQSTRPAVAMTYTCGIDIGTKNMCIAFLPIGTRASDAGGTATSRSAAIVTYRGTPIEMTRMEMGQPDREYVAFPAGTRKKDIDKHIGFAILLSRIEEFASTRSTVIEMQLSVNNTEMSRLDGIAFGFLFGRYPSMVVRLNGSGIRKGFITKAIEGYDLESIRIPKGIRPTKLLSLQFVAVLFPTYYEFIGDEGVDKYDDICDGIVYAALAALN